MKLSSLIPISHYMKMTSQNISQHISFRNCIHFRAGLFCTSFGGEKYPGFAGPESVGTLLVAEAGRLAVEAKQRSPFLGCSREGSLGISNGGTPGSLDGLLNGKAF